MWAKFRKMQVSDRVMRVLSLLDRRALMCIDYGLENVAAMIERSGGVRSIEYRDKDKRFSFSASLPMKTE